MYVDTDNDIAPTLVPYFLPDEATTLASVADPSLYADVNSSDHVGLLMFPVISGALTVIYNIPGKSSDPTLNFTADLIGKIFANTVNLWNDPAIVKLNPNIKLGNNSIQQITLGDWSTDLNAFTPSGLNVVFTTYISTYSNVFRTTPGLGSGNGLPQWSSSFLQPHISTQVVFLVDVLPYTIAYAPGDKFIYSNTPSYRVGAIYNYNNVPIAPSVATIQAATPNLPQTNTLDRHIYFSTVDNTVNNTAYPLAIMSFLIMREHYFYNSTTTPAIQQYCQAVREMLNLWIYVMTNKNAGIVTNDFQWSPISDSIFQRSLTSMSAITCNQNNMLLEINNANNLMKYYNNLGMSAFSVHN